MTTTDAPLTLTQARRELVLARQHRQTATDMLGLARARAEQRATAAAGGEIGRNEAERARFLVLALAADEHYQAALKTERQLTTQVEVRQCELDGLLDERRARELAVRERHLALLESGQFDDWAALGMA